MRSNDDSSSAESKPRGRGSLSAKVPAFVALWLAWAGLLAAAMVLGNTGWGLALGRDSAGGHGSIEATAARMGSSLTLVVVGWLAFASWRRSPAARFALCIAIGMTAGALGDFFNAGWLDFVPLGNPVLGGIVAFGLGHIAYITGCIDLAKRAGPIAPRPMVIAVAAWQLVGLAGWCFVALQGTLARALVWPALPYSLLLAGTAGVTSGLALEDRRWVPLALGAALFLASDLILAFELFRGHFAYDTECVWLTYGPGQMLIVFSTIIAAAAARRSMPT
jgi:uncharacterized membrane protein YhhN